MRSVHRALVVSIFWLLGTTCTTGAEAVHDVLDHGAKPDGQTLSTEAIQKAIDACAGEGGGTVRFPPGKFLSGSLRMKSGVTLLLDKDATLLGSRNRDDYYGPEFDSAGRPVEGSRVFRNLIHGEGLHDVAVRGKGTIDGNGSAFRDKTKKRTKAIYLVNCRNVLIEDVRMRSAGSWMQHYRLCEKLVIRNIDVFNHVAFNNDGLNVDSCREVTISGCRVDSDDDGIVLKSLSDRPCQDIRVTDCTVSSHCNALKMGTESGGGFVNIQIDNCTVFSPKHSESIYGRQRGLAGIALEIVDGGRLENVSLSNVSIEGVSVPIFLRLGNRARPYVSGAKPAVGTFRNVRLSNINAKGTGEIGCSITGLPGHPIENVRFENVRLGFDGGGTRQDTARQIPERETSYPESTMFGTLPAYGFYCRHVRGLRFDDLKLESEKPDLRHAMMFDDVEDLQITKLEAECSPGAASMLRMVQVRQAKVSGCSSKSQIETFLELEGDATEGIVLEENDLPTAKKVVEASADVPDDAVSRR